MSYCNSLFRPLPSMRHSSRRGNYKANSADEQHALLHEGTRACYMVRSDVNSGQKESPGDLWGDPGGDEPHHRRSADSPSACWRDTVRCPSPVIWFRCTMHVSTGPGTMKQ